MSGFYHSRRTRFAPAFRDAESCNCDLGKPCAEHEPSGVSRLERLRREEMDDVPIREDDA